MSTAFVPDADSLRELAHALRTAASGAADLAAQKQALDQLDALVGRTGYYEHLLYLLVTPSPDLELRSLAGLRLKDTLSRNPHTFTPSLFAYLKQAIWDPLADPNPTVANIAGIVLNTSVQVAGGVKQWPEALERLLDRIESGQTERDQVGAYKALTKICEDDAASIETLAVFQRLMTVLASHLTPSSTPSLRAHSLSCLFPFTSFPSSQLSLSLPSLLPLLLSISILPTSSSLVRRLVAQILSSLVEWSSSSLIAEPLDDVFQLILAFILNRDGVDGHSPNAPVPAIDGDSEVALQAAEFILSFADEPELAEHLEPRLEAILPVLLDAMVYEEDDPALADMEEDASVPDKKEDIKPSTYGGAKSHKQARADEPTPSTSTAASGSGSGSGSGKKAEEEDGEEEDEDWDEDDEDDELDGEWNLRKCAAAALDVFAVTFEEEMLKIVLPRLNEMMGSEDWLKVEAAILALGAIAEGCIQGLQPWLPKLIPVLISYLNHQNPPLRSIACWTLGRYSGWCALEASVDEHGQPVFLETMRGLLTMVLDNNKRVQEAGCSAFATLEEEAGARLVPYLGPILQNLVAAFTKYQQKNLLILYDAVGTFADSVSPHLDDANRSLMVEILLPPLNARWERLEDDDPDLIPLLECFSSFVIASGTAFAGFAEPVAGRCLRIVEKCLNEYAQYAQAPDGFEPPDRTLLVVSLDLLSGLTQALGMGVQSLLVGGQRSEEGVEPPSLQLLFACIGYFEPSVRQSAFAFLGDLAIHAFPVIQPHLQKIMTLLIPQIMPGREIKHEVVSVCNNAAWAAGEIALRHGANMAPYIHAALQPLGSVLLEERAARSLKENSAVTIGRFALVCADVVAPHLDHFIGQWSDALAAVKDNDEKDSAYRGICQAVWQNPNGVQAHLYQFITSVARWDRPSQDLYRMLAGDGTQAGILGLLKQNFEPQWNEATRRLQGQSPTMLQRLQDMYRV